MGIRKVTLPSPTVNGSDPNSAGELSSELEDAAEPDGRVDCAAFCERGLITVPCDFSGFRSLVRGGNPAGVIFGDVNLTLAMDMSDGRARLIVTSRRLGAVLFQRRSGLTRCTSHSVSDLRSSTCTSLPALVTNADGK